MHGVAQGLNIQAAALPCMVLTKNDIAGGQGSWPKAATWASISPSVGPRASRIKEVPIAAQFPLAQKTPV